MKLIRPTAVTDGILVSSSVAEDDYPAWDIATTYALGDRTIQSHRIFESVQAANTGNNPETGTAGWWADIGPTNKWAMFDRIVGTETTANESVSITLEPGRIDSIALLQVYGATVSVAMVVDAETVYEKSVSLIDDSMVTDWSMYFFEPIRPKDYAVFDDLPIFGEASVTISIEKPSGIVRCGMCIVGLKSDIGETQMSPALGINDYSKKTTDDFGNTTLIERSFSKRMGAKLVVKNSDVDRIHAALSALRATPVVWIGSGKYSSMLIFGFFRDFEIDIAYATFSYCTLNIEGMI